MDEEETEEMAEIELSSDEDASDDECALIVLKRPPVTERTVEEVEVMEDDDIAMCGEGTGSINAKEKSGYVKEYIETEGLAMILSKVSCCSYSFLQLTTLLMSPTCRSTV